jgi:hypothetical protein
MRRSAFCLLCRFLLLAIFSYSAVISVALFSICRFYRVPFFQLLFFPLAVISLVFFLFPVSFALSIASLPYIVAAEPLRELATVSPSVLERASRSFVIDCTMPLVTFLQAPLVNVLQVLGFNSSCNFHHCSG